MAGETNFGHALETARIGNPMLYARRVLICVISSFFASPELNTFPGAPDNPWQLICDPSGGVSKDSKILITDRFSTNNSAQRPQIVVGRGSASWGDMVIGDQANINAGGYGWTRERSNTDSVFVPLEISVYAQNDIEAENIAWAVSFCLKAYEVEIKKSSLIYKLESTTTGAALPYKISSEYESFKVDLQTAAHIMMTWRKRSTLSIERLQDSLCKITGMGTAVKVGDLCVFAKPKNPPETWT